MTQIAPKTETIPIHMPMPTLAEAEGKQLDVFGILKRRKWLIFFGLVVGLGLGTLYYVKAPVMYGSSAVIFVQKKTPAMIPVSGTSMVMPDLQFESHAKVIASEHLVDAMLENPLNKQIRQLTSFEGMSDFSIRETILEELEVIADVDDPNVYAVFFRGPEQDECKVVLDKLIEEYRLFLVKKEKTLGTETQDLLNASIADVVEEIGKVEDKIKEHRQANYDVVFNDDGTIANSVTEDLKELSSIERELKMELENLEQDLQWIATQQEAGQNRSVLLFLLNRNEKETLAEEADLKIDRTEQEHLWRLFDMQYELLELRSGLGPDHPDVKTQEQKVQSYLDTMSRFAGGAPLLTGDEEVDLVGWYVIALQERRNKIVKLIEATQEDYGATLNVARHFSNVQLEDRKLHQELERYEEIYQHLMTALQEATMTDLNIAEDSTANRDTGAYDFVVLQEAPDLAEQVAPSIIKSLGIGGFLGMLLGFGLAYLVDMADKTFRSPLEITQQMHMPLIGHVPVIAKDALVEYTDSRVDPSIISYHRPKSKMAESYRAVRTALYFSTQGEDHRVIQVTSPSPGDGKTTLSANLATSIANSGKRVLLIDADLRRPRVHKLFGLDEEIGFAAVLQGEADWREACYTLEVENLMVMPCGTRPSNPAELLTSKRLPELLAVLRDEFDYVIVDSPPVLAVTDPCTIAPRVDTTILTFRIKKNIKVSAERARELLTSVGGNLLGIVVNGVGGTGPISAGRYGYGGYGTRYYNYNYGYGESYGAYGGYTYNDEYYDDDDELPEQTVNGTARVGHRR